MHDAKKSMQTVAAAIVLSVLSGAKAVADDVPGPCYGLYYSFIDADTWESMGRIAKTMDENGCWLPVPTHNLHGEGDERDLPEIIGDDQKGNEEFATNCRELAPYTVGMSEEHDAAPIIKILDPQDAKSSKVGGILELRDFNRMLAGLQPIHQSVAPTIRPLNCVGNARFSGRGQSLIQFWLDRDPDGEEFIGYQIIDW